MKLDKNLYIYYLGYCLTTTKIALNKLAFGQTRFASAADPIEHISEEKFLLQIFAKMETL